MSVQTISQTDFKFPGQKSLYHGKVRDVYSIGNHHLIMVATDRISAFDVILPRAIPYKGQVLNQIAAYFLEETSDVAPNWLMYVPDPNVALGHRGKPYKLEMIVRAALIGSSWRNYNAGKREICGVALPEGMKEYDLFEAPIVTPTTKAEEGHDEDIDPVDAIKQGIVTQTEYDQMERYALDLFARGQEMAKKHGLFLADTKYEFGEINSKVCLIDEIHTPDSSRYFYADGYDGYLADRKQPLPKHLSKEFVREWLMEKGFSGQKGQKLPKMDDAFVNSVSERYIELYQEMTGKKFKKPREDEYVLKRIENNITNALERLL